jgi:tetratricopeptide (TPR) repeat protein
MKRTILHLSLLGLLLGYVGSTFGQSEQAGQSSQNRTGPPDSVLANYTIEELLEFRRQYEAYRDSLLREKDRLRQQGIRDMEEFIDTNPNSRVMDKIIIRLAELYYEAAQVEFEQRQELYNQQLALYEQGAITELPPEPQRDYSRALDLYLQILERYPESSLVDDALYNVAFLTEELGQQEEAFRTYEKLIREHPDSPYVPDALLRMAEYYFNPPVNEIEKAIELYKEVLAFKDSPKYDEALYRLGWSYYRLSNYPEAIAYFTLLADDVDRGKELDPAQKIINPAVRDESVEYIAISFLDFGGAEKAKEYLQEIGGRPYGIEILKKIGDVYMDVKEEYDQAIASYQILLELYPTAEEAPVVQAKIAEAYRRLENERMTYLRRAELFKKYSPGSEWWEAVTDAAKRDEALKLAERALRENINLLLRRAKEQDNRDLFVQVVKDSRDYLESFPNDSSAALIHWNMALILETKLNDFDSAFEEYIKISNLYWDSPFQKQAAQNAIALAQREISEDTLAFAVGETVPTDTTAQVGKEGVTEATMLATELRPGEQKLATALDNYIKLFPHEPETAEILSIAGGLYFNKRHFRDALKYFKTLLKHFPDSDRTDYARAYVMESYFWKKDYSSTEAVAKRLADRAANPEQREKALRRLAEAIFLQAKSYADQGKHLEAAEEFERVANEVPDAVFADLALYNSGLEFDKANEYSRAVEVYSRLISDYPNSEYFLNALNNLAWNYGELRDYLNAAITFERLADMHPDSAQAEAALYNASVNFGRAEDWERAIRANRKFVERFPNSEDADDLFYDIATYYLKLNDLDGANRVYGEYAAKFPDSPRTVETFYRRGEYFLNQGQVDAAMREFESAVEKNRLFKDKGVEANDFFAAEALFKLTDLRYQEFDAIEFRLPMTELEKSRQRKRELLVDVVNGYKDVATYGTIRLYEAMYRIGEAYEEFAQTWARQEIPALDENRRIVAEKEINETAASLYEEAVVAYKNAVKVIDRLAETHKKSLADTAAVMDTAAVAEEAARKVTAADTTLRVAQRWLERSKQKVSEVIYDIAEINQASVNRLLNAPVPEGIDRITAMEFRHQLLSRFVRPLVDKIVEAHTRNLREAEEIGLENQWVALSRARIVTTSNLIPTQYIDLGYQALKLYEQDISRLDQAVASDDPAILDIADEMANYIDFGKAYAMNAANGFRQTLERADSIGIAGPEVQNTEETLMSLLYRYSVELDSVSVIADQYRKKYKQLLESTGETRYEDAVEALADNFFTLKESARELLEIAFDTAKSHGIENEWTREVTLALVRLDPEKYGDLFGLSVQQFTVPSSDDWLVSGIYENGWTSIEFRDQGWELASVVSLAELLADTTVQRIWLILPDTVSQVPMEDTLFAVPEVDLLDTTMVDTTGAEADTTQFATFEISQRPAKRVYFRKRFMISGLPVSGRIQLAVDDSYNLFLNGEYIAQHAMDPEQGVVVVPHELGDYLRSGENVLAVEAVDTDDSGGGLEALLLIEHLPGWEKMQADIAKQTERHREILIFDKQIVPEN